MLVSLHPKFKMIAKKKIRFQSCERYDKNYNLRDCNRNQQQFTTKSPYGC